MDSTEVKPASTKRRRRRGEKRRLQQHRQKLSVYCPRCLISYKEMGDACQGCGYSAAICVSRFPYAAPPLSGLHVFYQGLETTNFFGKRCLAIFSRLQMIFPELGVYVVTVDLGERVECREFAFWLFNAAPFAEGDSVVKRQAGVMLLIDTAGCNATVVTGYGIEPYLNPDRINQDLESLKKSLQKGQIGKAVESWLLLLMRHLRDAHAESKSLERGGF